ncbi:ribonuclease P protein component 2 [Candidatus Woesearchaeota archaeon]|nr:ribonuclease P protein component 2 [Candidatus Woesearchaeota archaeon]
MREKKGCGLSIKGDNKINKVKALPPTLKESKRYLVYKMINENSFNFKDVKSAIDDSCLRFLGELNYSKAGIMHLEKFNNNIGILRISSKYVNEVKTALALINNIQGKKVILDCVGVSGTLKKARLKFVKMEEN